MNVREICKLHSDVLHIRFRKRRSYYSHTAGMHRQYLRYARHTDVWQEGIL